MNRVTQEIRIKPLLEMPIICKNEDMVKIQIFKTADLKEASFTKPTTKLCTIDAIEKKGSMLSIPVMSCRVKFI